MLEVDALRVTFGDVVALDEASVDVPTGSIAVVMGPSGCGKSTLLRVIAGLETPDHGSVSWMGRDLRSTPTHQRGFGLMFQDYALFPHRTVGRNVAFGLRMAGWESDAIARRVAEVLDLVGLGGYTDRRIGGLSGGEQQRVALARALAPSPALLMLDEPIGALDRDLRAQLMADMRAIFRELGLTVLYVTHDQDEAFGLADRIAVMRAGKVLTTGTPEGLWADPISPFVARFMGRENVLSADAVERMASAGVIEAAATAMTIAPDALHVEPRASGAGAVTESRFVAGTHRTTIDIDGVTLVATTPHAMAPGARVTVTVDASRIVPLEDE